MSMFLRGNLIGDTIDKARDNMQKACEALMCRHSVQSAKERKIKSAVGDWSITDVWARIGVSGPPLARVLECPAGFTNIVPERFLFG